VNTSGYEHTSKQRVDAKHGLLIAVDASGPPWIPGVADDE
jgi:hypothetical protein